MLPIRISLVVIVFALSIQTGFPQRIDIENFNNTDPGLLIISGTDEPRESAGLQSVAFAENRQEPASHRRHAWGIKSGDKIKESDRRRYNSQRRHFRDLELRREGELIVSLCPLRAARQLFTDKKDGLALEFIPLGHYLSDSIYYNRPALRNGACIFNGFVTMPVYRDEILALARDQLKERKHPDLLIGFGDIPEILENQDFQVNLIVLRKNRIIDRIRFSAGKGRLMDFPVQIDTIASRYELKKVNISWKPERETMTQKIYFDRNETRIDPAEVSTLAGKLRDPGLKVVACTIYGFASVEGTPEINRELYARRAQNLLDIILKESGGSVTAKVRTEENWPMFRNQLRDTEYSFLSDSSESYIRNFFPREEFLVLFEKELDDQRYVGLHIDFEEIETEEKVIDYALRDYIRTFRYHDSVIYNIALRDPALSQNTPGSRSGNQTRPGPSRLSRHSVPEADIKRMLAYQQFIFAGMLKGTIPFTLIDSLPYSFRAMYEMRHNPERITYEYMAFRLAHDRQLTMQDRYNCLKYMADTDFSDPQTAINYFILTLNKKYHDSVSPDQTGLGIPSTQFRLRMKHFIDLLEQTDSGYCMDELRAYYYIGLITDEYIKNPGNNFATTQRAATGFLSGYFLNPLLDEELRYNAVLFFELLRLNDPAMQILESIYLEDTTNPEIIRHYIISALNYSDYTHSEKYRLLEEITDLLSPDEWCGLSRNSPAIDYSILDHEMFRNLWCKHCGCVK
jgi:hypothetical protein